MCQSLCKEASMATNLNIDPKLLSEAVKVAGHKTKKEAVNTALAEYIDHHKRKSILDFFGKVEMDPTYNYKKERSRRDERYR